MTVNEAVKQFLEYLRIEKGCSDLTVESYEQKLDRFKDWVTDETLVSSVEDVDLELIRNYRLHLARSRGADGETLERVTQRYHLIALRALLRYLAVQRNMTVLAADRIELPKGAARSVSFLSLDQVDRLMSSADSPEEPGLRDRAIMEMLFSTGMRVSELVRLDRDKIDLESRELGITGKGNRTRVVFLSDQAVVWIRKYLDSRDDDYKPLFIRYRGRKNVKVKGEAEGMRLTRRSVERIVLRYAGNCKLQVKTTPHTLRHSFATDLLSSGADIRSVQEMLGHRNVATTQVYTHVTDKQLKEVHRAFHSRSTRTPESGKKD